VTRNKVLRPTVESLGIDCIDVRKLRRRGFFRDGWTIFQPLLSWPTVSRVSIARFIIILKFRDRVVDQQIRVSWTRCHFGGTRPWLHCLCGRRVARLFKGLSGYYCRQCSDNPRYASQTKSKQRRLAFAAGKLRLRLNGMASLSEPLPERPRGMHRRTFIQLLRRLEALEARLPSRQKANPTDYVSLVFWLTS
jgi:hypothetical protein